MIGSANLDGTASRMVLFNTKVLGHPFSITVFEDKVSYTLHFALLFVRSFHTNYPGDKLKILEGGGYFLICLSIHSMRLKSLV